MNKYPVLLAKSNGETIREHTSKVVEVISSMRGIFKTVERVTNDPHFWDLIDLAAWMHDAGKGADGFQESVRGISDWGNRHELISAGLAQNLVHANFTPMQANILSVIIASHHAKLSKALEIQRLNDTEWNKWLHDEFPNGFSQLEKELNDRIHPSKISFCYPPPNPFALLKKWQEWSKAYLWERSNKNVSRSTFFPTDEEKILKLVLGTGALISADHLASMGRQKVLSFGNMRNKLESVVPHLNDMQIEIVKESEKKSLLLEAPTGSGKTLGALLWASGNGLGTSRLFYVLPYRASIHAMQDELIKTYGMGDDFVGVLHAKAADHIYNILSESDEEKRTKMAKSIAQETQKIFRPVKVSTPHQLAKAVLGAKWYEPLWLELSGGLLVIDEVHAYEPWLIGIMVQLCKLTKRLGGHVMAMTATWPDFLKGIFSNALNSPKEIIAEQKAWDQTRHKLELHESSCDGMIDEISICMKKYRTLVVCNTVRRAQSIFKKLREKAKSPLLLHSQFRQKDRETIEQSMKGCDLLVGTQAVEVSLNMSFGEIFTDIAPIDDIVQRFGRTNRYKEVEIAKANVMLAYDKDDVKIYGEDILAKAAKMLREFGCRPFSNQDAKLLVKEQYKYGWNEEQKTEYDQVVTLIDEILKEPPLLYLSEYHKWSEIDEKATKSIEVILTKDIGEYQQALKEKKPFKAKGYLIPLSSGNFYYLQKMGRADRNDSYAWIDVPYDERVGILWDKIGGKWEDNIIG